MKMARNLVTPKLLAYLLPKTLLKSKLLKHNILETKNVEIKPIWRISSNTLRGPDFDLLTV